MDTLVRRDVLAAAVAGLAGLFGVPSEPAAAARIRTVEKQIPLKYTYNPATGVTKVRTFRRKKVVVKFGSGCGSPTSGRRNAKR